MHLGSGAEGGGFYFAPCVGNFDPQSEHPIYPQNRRKHEKWCQNTTFLTFLGTFDILVTTKMVENAKFGEHFDYPRQKVTSKFFRPGLAEGGGVLFCTLCWRPRGGVLFGGYLIWGGGLGFTAPEWSRWSDSIIYQGGILYGGVLDQGITRAMRRVLS